jgi:hypothetical protein
VRENDAGRVDEEPAACLVARIDVIGCPQLIGDAKVNLTDDRHYCKDPERSRSEGGWQDRARDPRH